MAVFQIGTIIKNRREESGLSQEALADGICSVPTLSRIENGERMPTKNHFEMLMQRLGYSAMSVDFFTDKSGFYEHELKFRIRHAYIEGNRNYANFCLKEFEKTVCNLKPSDKQFIVLYKTLLDQDKYSAPERLKLYEMALRYTCPKYTRNNIPKVLSYEEIILLNNIAICLDYTEEREQALQILFSIMNYYEKHVVNTEESLRTQPMIIYNLSKMLRSQGSLDQCIEICDQGIQIARNTGRSIFLGKTLYTKAWALLQRNNPGDIETARECAKQAFCFACAMEDQEDQSVCCKLYAMFFLNDNSI